jgi:hypothetical protein
MKMYMVGDEVIHNSNGQLRGTIIEVRTSDYAVRWNTNQYLRFYRHNEIRPDGIVRPFIAEHLKGELFEI